MSLLPKEKSKKSTELSEQIMLIYGRPKIGKSTLCSCFPDALFIATEPGLRGLSVNKVNVTSWETFIDVFTEIAKGEHNYKTIVIDTADKMLKLIRDYVVKGAGVNSIGDLGHGKGYTESREILSETIDRMASLPYGLIFVSHCVTEVVETKLDKYNRWTITVGAEKDNDILMNLMDIILFMDSKIIGGEEVGVIHTKPSMNFDAGDKSMLLPTSIEFPPNNPAKAFEVIEKAFGGSK